MAKTQRVTVELGFKSNTQEVKKNINELAANLKQISNIQIGLKGSDLDHARQAAKDLTLELQKAVNVDTGRLDLNKLTTNLKKSNKDIVSLSAELLKAGPIGQRSFLQIAQAMSAAEVPMVKINQGLKDFMDNLGKNMKWQIAQTAIQTVQGSLQNAVREAEQLNQALNDIRIVTGYDKTAMASFAKEANKAAKELKTTTKEYAEASLIFYQQGLRADEVAKRAETVVKMSQVTGDSAKAVSDQMTAIWNNFDNGSKSLEYYADAMAKLGADTAASTSEIANGLEKFAAIAETVGLSYETAMASIATVIDKTRQSADVVGTAFKTIFARVQGLSMDGVTDDGVSLNKYSQALKKVGVDVLTASGELRDMDEILNDLGAKWKGLGRESQVAVAQVVGGARQYNQLLSLMDNWSEVQSNILKAEGSTGEISKQAEIWADSYEAAANRVEEAKARAAENFLNSEDVVNLTNAFADLIEWTDKFIDSFGGVAPLALSIVGLFSHKLIPIIKTGFTAFGNNFKTFMGNTLGSSEKLIKDTQDQFNNFLEAQKNNKIEDSLKAQIEWNQKLIKVKQHMAQITKYMSEQEKESAMAALSMFEESVQAAIKAGEALTESQRKVKYAKAKVTRMDILTGAQEEVFRQHKITTDEEKNKAREYAKGNIQKKLDSIDTIQLKEMAINDTEKNIQQKKGQLQDLLGDKNISDIYKELYQQSKLKKQSETEGKVEEALTAENRIKQLEEILRLNTEITEEEKKQAQQREQLEEIYTYKNDRGALEAALDLQKKNQILSTQEGRLSTSFGTTDFRIDEQLTLNNKDKENYANVMEATKQKAVSIDGEQVQLSFSDENNKQMQISIQNFEVLKTKALEYQLIAEELLQVNMEFAGNIDNMANSMIDATELKANFEKAAAEREQAEAEAGQLKEGDEGYSAAQEKLAKAKEKEEKALKKLTKAQIHNMNTTKNATKAIKENKKQIIDLAKSTGASEDEIKELSEAIDEIDNSPNAFKKVANSLKSLETAAFSASNSLDVMGEEMEDALIKNGVPAQRIEEIKNALEELKRVTLENANAQKQAKSSVEDYEEAFKNFNDKFESIVSGVGQATAAISGMYASVNQLFDAFDSSNTPMETFLGILGSLIAMAPAVTMGIKAISAANSAYAKKKIADNAKEANSEATTAGIEVVSEGAKHTASMNAAGIAASIAAAAMLATIGISAGIARSKANKKEQQREQNTANIEAAQKSNEVASAVQTESQAIDELIGQYNKLSDSEKASSELKDDIINQVDKVIEKYQEYANSVNMATDAEQNLKSAIQELEIAQTLGDIEGIKKVQEKADLIIAKEAKNKNDLGIAGILGNIGLKEDAKQVKAKDGYVQRQVGGAGEEEDEANQILQKAMGSSVVKTRDRGTRIKLRTDSAEHFIEDYDKLQTAVDNMYNSPDSRVKDPNINDTLRECLELLSTYQEEYNSLKSQVASGAVHNAQIAMGNVGKSVSDIKSYTDYADYKTVAQENIDANKELTEKEKKQAKESLDNQLSMNSELKDFTDLEKKIGAITKEGEDANTIITSLLKKVDAKALLEVDVNLYTRQEEIEDEAKRIEEALKREEIEANINAYADIKESLKPEGMTEEDWLKISENKIFKDNPEAFKEFIGLSYAQQIAEITEQENKLHKNRRASLEAEIESYKKTIRDDTSTVAAKENAREQVKPLETELEILKRIRKEQDEYIANLRKSDIGDIYHDINQELTELEKHYQKIQQLQNEVYGAEALELFDDLIDNLKQQNEQLEIQATLSRNEAKAERNQLTNKYKEEFGIDLTFDRNGNLNNYNEVLDYLYGLGKSEAETEALVDQWEKDYGDYTSVNDRAYADEEKIAENKRLQQEINFKKITSKVDLQLELKDIYTQQIEYDINKTMENMWTTGQFDKVTTGLTEQFNMVGNVYNSITEEISQLDAALAAGDITEPRYIERMKELQGESLNSQQALDQLAESVINLYSHNLQRAEEEISKFTSQMDHFTSVTEHYKTLFDLLGESTSTSMGMVLTSQTALAKNNFDVSKEIYTQYSKNAEEAKTAYDNYVKEKGKTLDKANDKEYQALEEAWLASREAANKAQDDMLNDAAAWGQAVKGEIEFNMQAAAKSIEKELTGNIGFEQLTAQMSRRSTMQEEFLTATNQAYEVEKMMHSLENDMLKTDNARAKQRLKAFHEETKQLKQSEKLSKVELNIQQKKYDLLLAELALEDAKNTKSTVRLTRTADGGFGYVYTADETQVNEAEQAKYDAENALYNTRLEAANTYTEKRVQIQQELNQELAALAEQYKNGEIESYQMYQELQTALIQDYQELYEDYSEIYQLAVEEDSQVATEAWSSGVATLLDEQNEFNSKTGELIDSFAQKITKYQNQVNAQLQAWDKFTTKFKKDVGLNLEGTNTSIDGTEDKIEVLKGNLEKMTKASSGLKDALLGKDDKPGVVGTMDALIDTLIDKETKALNTDFSNLLTNIKNLGDYFGILADNISSTVQNASGLSDIKSPPPAPEAPPPANNPSKPTFSKDGDTFEGGYYETWEKAYKAALSGKNMKYTPDYTQTKDYNNGVQAAIKDATKLAQSHLAEGGLKANSSLTAGEISIKGQDELSKQINESYQTELAKAQGGQRTETSFAYQAPKPIEPSTPEEEKEEKFSWEKILEMWENEDFYNAEQTLKKNLGSDVGEQAKWGYYYYNKDGYGNVTEYFNKLKSNNDNFNYDSYIANYNKDMKETSIKGIAKYALDPTAPANLEWLNYLTDQEKMALEALTKQKELNNSRKNTNQKQVEEILNNIVKSGQIDIPAIKKALTLEVARDYISNSRSKETYIQETKNGQPIQNYEGPQTVDQLANDWFWWDKGDWIEMRVVNDKQVLQDLYYKLNKETIANWIDRFDTGGYTGSWGPEGKMAMLHEKEIVLNKTDTANLLDSIQLLHSILQTIDLQAANAQFSSLSPGQLFQAANTGDILEQNVHIEAHFDNVRDRDEIVEAFNTLVNRASQYANRKK